MTTSLPQTNANLVSIARPSKTENYTEAESTPTTVWSGEVDAYVQRRVVSALNESGELNRAQSTNIIIPSDLEPPVDVEGGDTITFTQWDPVRGELRTYAARAQTFSTPMDLPSLPNEVKIALEKVRAVP